MRIGLTGGIASGKSLIAGMLKDLGAHVLDADAISRELVAPGSPGLEAVAREFGPGVISPGGGLDRAKLGALVFSDEGARQRLNAILHPRIKALALARAAAIEAEHPEALIVIEAPLLVECGWQDMVDQVWTVTAPVEERIRRISGRDGLGREAALRRISAQLSDEERNQHAHVIIENGGGIEELENRVAALCAAAAGEHEKEESQGQRGVDKGCGGGAYSPGAADNPGIFTEQGAGKAFLQARIPG